MSNNWKQEKIEEFEKKYVWQGQQAGLHFKDGVLASHVKQFLLQTLSEAEERVTQETKGTDLYSYMDNELHIYARSVIDTVVVTRNGEKFVIQLPPKSKKENTIPLSALNKDND